MTHTKEELLSQSAKTFVSERGAISSERCPLDKHASGSECCPDAVTVRHWQNLLLFLFPFDLLDVVDW